MRLFNGLQAIRIKKSAPPGPGRRTIKSVSSFRLQSVTPPAAGHIQSGKWKCITQILFFCNRHAEKLFGIEVSAGSGSSWESSEPSGGYLGRSAGPLHEHKRASHVHGGYADRKIAGVAGEAPIADAAQAIASASSWRACARAAADARRPSVQELLPASEGRPRQPRQARPSIRPHFRGARKRLIPVVDLNDGRRQNRGEQSRQKEEDHRHRQNRRQRCGFFLSHGHS